MGELESLLVYEKQSVKIEPDLSIVTVALEQLREPKVETTIEKEIKIAFEELKTDKNEARFEDLKPVIEQELDPSLYTNNGYSLYIEYGGQKFKVHYESYDAKAEGNGASYEHKELEDAQVVAEAARKASET